MIRKAAGLITTLLSAAGFWGVTFGQNLPTILTIDLANATEYQQDISDPTKFALNPSATPSAGVFEFSPATILGDIVSVNGQPAKGLFAARTIVVATSPNPSMVAGALPRAIADVARNSIREIVFDILQQDGTPVGSIMGLGLNGGSPSPGAPSIQRAGNIAIVGGTGAFLGARGQLGLGPASTQSASTTEDPAFRRTLHASGTARWVLTIVPMTVPQIVTTASGPAVTHSSDFSLVTPSKPAAAGEVLSLFATGLGPVNPSVDPGQPFPSNPLAVNSPVEVTVNGKHADLIAAVGYPGAADGYQVNFRVPPDTAQGTASIQLIVAWIAGNQVNITVR